MSIKISNLIKKFDEKIIFDDFSFEFNNNGIYILNGDSGAGKTTLLRIIAGLDKDFEGEIIKSDKTCISYCFQEYRLFPWLNAIDNIVIAISDKNNESIRDRAAEILRLLNFSETDMKLMPNELSGGMKQRVSFARALLYPSNVLLLDEVTKELDENLSIKILDIIKEEAKNRLIILVTHKPLEIQYLSGEIININDLKS